MKFVTSIRNVGLPTISCEHLY